jgi:hypothetical protein
VQRFEARAAQHGCTLAYLQTFNFQAPRLYASLGYQVCHRIEGFGRGIVKHFMVHAL